MLRIQLILLLILAIVPYSPASVVHVPADQPTIQAGITAAINGDTVARRSRYVHREH